MNEIEDLEPEKHNNPVITLLISWNIYLPHHI